MQGACKTVTSNRTFAVAFRERFIEARTMSCRCHAQLQIVSDQFESIVDEQVVWYGDFSRTEHFYSTNKRNLWKFRYSLQANLENTSERLIKAIAELRRRIHNAKEKLDKEIHVSRTAFQFCLSGIEIETETTFLYHRLA